jgi:hypothetical protein
MALSSAMGAIERWTGAMRAARYDDAWAIEAAILADHDPATRDDPRAPYHRRWVWDGTPLAGRDVLVRCYHGLGDTIQFARYLPALCEVAASVTVEAPGRLLPLLATVAGKADLTAFDQAAPAVARDAAVEITELAFALRLAPDAVPIPYLSATRAALPAGTTGLCYAAGDWDASRNVPPALLDELCRLGSTLSLVARPTDLPVLNPEGCPFDIGATAALVAGCGQVVTVDTMIAHLAGALGRPTWLMLKHDPDWRWDPASRTSAWYPTMRVVAQRTPGDWAGVVGSVAADLHPHRADAARG